MNQKTFFNAVGKCEHDILGEFVALLEEQRIEYSVIGGLAVNAYVEPVVSLDLEIVVAVQQIDTLLSLLPDDYRVETFAHSINISSKKSDLLIQLQTDSVYQGFFAKAQAKDVLGYKMRVAAAEDVLRGKALAYSDASRRASKRQKDFADILRLVEAMPELIESLSAELRSRIDDTVG